MKIVKVKCLRNGLEKLVAVPDGYDIFRETVLMIKGDSCDCIEDKSVSEIPNLLVVAMTDSFEISEYALKSLDKEISNIQLDGECHIEYFNAEPEGKRYEYAETTN